MMTCTFKRSLFRFQTHAYKHKSGSAKREMKRKMGLQAAASQRKQSKLRFSSASTVRTIGSKDETSNDEDYVKNVVAIDRCPTIFGKQMQNSKLCSTEETILSVSSETNIIANLNNIVAEDCNEKQLDVEDNVTTVDIVEQCPKISLEQRQNKDFSSIGKPISSALNQGGPIPSFDNLTDEVCGKKNLDIDYSRLSAFIPPRLNANTSEKLSFLLQHPIQPSGDKNSLPFDGSRIYYRKLPTGNLVRRESISYSLELNKLFCSTCMCFASADTSENRSPFVDGVTPSTKHIYDRLIKHEESQSHRTAVCAMLTARKKRNVEQHIKQTNSEDISKRRLVLKRVIDIILFISRQGIAYRGKSEAMYSMTDISENHGNFLNLIILLSKYDPVLKIHMSEAMTESKKRKDSGKTKGRGALLTFMSKNIVNKLINICARHVKQEIIRDVKEAKTFSLNVDSCQDVGIIDQVAICVRYVKNGIPQERVISMLQVRKSTGEGYKELVTAELTKLGLNVQDIISVSFDGAGNMSGRNIGLQAKLREEVPNLIFTHCYAHVLNLVLAAATSSCTVAKNLFGLLETTSVFIHESFKRTAVWIETIGTLTTGRDKLRRLQNIGKTRWWSKDKALNTIMDKTRYVALIETLHTISSNKEFEPKVAFQAKALMDSFLKFETILTAFVYKKIFALSTPVSKYLQTPSLDYLKAWILIKNLEKELTKQLDLFETVFNAASLFASQVDELIHKNEDMHMEVEVETTLPLRRISKKPKQYDELCEDEIGQLSADRKRLYSINVYKVILNTAIVTINEKFSCNESLMKDAACLDPKNFHETSKTTLPDDALYFIASVAKVDRNQLAMELDSFSRSFNELSKTIWDELNPTSARARQCINIPDDEEESDSDDDDDEHENDMNQMANTKSAISLCRKCIPCACNLLTQYNMHISSYSNLYVAYCTLLTISFTQVSCERRFSALKRIKTRLRSLLRQELLDSLIILNTEADLIKDGEDSFYETIIDDLAETSPLLKKLLIA